MCSILGIPRSTYYSKVNSKKSNREIKNETIKKSIMKIYNNSKYIYGAPRIYAALIKKNINISLKKVQRLMKDLGIYSITIKKYKPTSSKKPKEGLENVLKCNFSNTTINEKWVRDITYIHTLVDGWCYLASILNLHSKKILGYSFRKNMTNELVTTALKNACYLQGVTSK